MRMLKAFLLIFIFVFSAVYVFAKEKTEETRTIKKGSLLVAEGTDKQTIREVSQMKERFNQLEAEQKELKEIIKDLMEVIELSEVNIKELARLVSERALVTE